MNKLLSSLLSSVTLAAGLLFSATASAGLTTWTDTQAINQYVGVLGSGSYTHDLTVGSTLPFAFQPGGMTALKGTIAIEIYDDTCNGNFWACLGNALQEGVTPEIVLFQIEDFDFDTGSIQLGLGDFSASLGLNALASINGDGMLSVIVQSLGDDFILGRSTLTVEGVPEPETLGMLGGALLALSLLQRRNRRA